MEIDGSEDLEIAFGIYPSNIIIAEAKANRQA